MRDVIGQPEERQCTAIIRKGACMSVRRPRMRVLCPGAGSTVGCPGGVITVYQCVHGGKVGLPNLTETPDMKKELLCGNSLEDKNYQQHIRSYLLSAATTVLCTEKF
ncbi:hypothetical protein AVEN_64318-1 [Araneus ventricosus]|uniref:Uncharacterized protein n=1 Tax=Araneus ventricosus TaxID=182803 RepID=A0A4Y2PFT0_ARAVE|nr:hypothetical protein AVEN_64318-1 [Araneus ventricosus]